MFDYSLLHWTAFLSAAVLLNISPGPDIVFILGQTIKGGTRAGIAAMVGIWTGALLHVTAATVGLSAILATSAIAFSAVKWIGAAYLIWLGVNAIRSSGGGLIGAQPQAGSSPLSQILRQGVLVCALNPKVAIFFLAFLPQFVVPGAGSTWAQLLFHGLLIIAVAAVIEPLLVLAAGRIARAIRRNPALTQWLERSLGVLLVALGCKLALAER